VRCDLVEGLHAEVKPTDFVDRGKVDGSRRRCTYPRPPNPCLHWRRRLPATGCDASNSSHGKRPAPGRWVSCWEAWSRRLEATVAGKASAMAWSRRPLARAQGAIAFVQQWAEREAKVVPRDTNRRTRVPEGNPRTVRSCEPARAPEEALKSLLGR
jgi:hypothetical protein